MIVIRAAKENNICIQKQISKLLTKTYLLTEKKQSQETLASVQYAILIEKYSNFLIQIHSRN